ncbi:protein jag [Irregularibacter muris]|uniref:RNA-binding protein KhpB n=1 Tax=Irregularibacter muris TaxID=1796619 RepID=A0AAE3L2T7_9FIRM|nr:RNA-binding cell elongation regulator Jag/EloR [Irregularibacter muris]MCR1899249.1 protein jag [Irregularibacter muris]
MKKIVATGKTIQEAIEHGLEELQLREDQVETNVVEEPSKGLFGLWGNKLAKVEISVKDNVEEMASSFMTQILEAMNIEAKITTQLDEHSLEIEIEGVDMGILIGRRGQTLDAIQYLVSLVVNKNREKYIRVVVDTEDYRAKREKTLEQLALRLAKKVEKTNKKVLLEPMNPYERRIIHSILQNHPKVTTYSEGEEPYRKVVIALK